MAIAALVFAGSLTANATAPTTSTSLVAASTITLLQDDATEEVDLQGNFEFLTVIIPTLGQASKLEAQIARESGGTFYSVWHWDADAAGDFLGQTTSITTSRAITFNK